MIHTLAPAKVNWTLEVLRRRDDGYHEVRSLLQTVDLCDELWFEEEGQVSLTVEGPGADVPREDQLVVRAAALLAEAGAAGRGCRITLRKRVPAAAGLGGGSSNAAAALRALNELWKRDLSRERLSELASGLGSDVPFFLYGGTALAEGRGEAITPLPDPPASWLVLLAPPISMPGKTARMYASLRATDFTDGGRTRALAERLRGGAAPGDDALYNAFERVAFEAFPELPAYRAALLDGGARRAHLAGSGPALFALAADEREAKQIASRLGDAGLTARAVRTLGAVEATRIELDA